MQIIHKIALDLQQSGAPVRVYAKQGDSLSRAVEIKLYNGGTAWAVPADATILQIAFGKPDRTGGCYDTMPDSSVACTVSGNTVTAQLHPQVLTCAGAVRCELRLLNASGLRLGTFCWIIEVEAAADSNIKSQDYWHFATLDGLWAAIGDMDKLSTQHKATLVGAICELLGKIGDVNIKISDLANAVKALTAEDIAAQLHYDATATTVKAALGKIEAWIGDLATLDTADKSDLVTAINAVLSSVDAGEQSSDAHRSYISALDMLATAGGLAIIACDNGQFARMAIRPASDEIGEHKLVTVGAVMEMIDAAFGGIVDGQY